MKRAVSMVRAEPHYRSDAVHAGLIAAGYELHAGIRDPRPDDVLVTWNRYGHYEVEAQRFEKAGATVIVMENGIIGAVENAYAKQFDPHGRQLFVLALNYHNGAGRWYAGERGRWREQGIDTRPWRKDGGHVLVLPQRGFGHPRVAPPHGWLERTLAQLRARTKRPIRVRPHPGNEPALKPLEDDLRDCWAVVTWGSGAAIKALCAGVPAFSEWDAWIGAPAAERLLGRLERPLCSDAAREAMLDRLGWLQWSTTEIASGEPFRQLLALAEQSVAA